MVTSVFSKADFAKLLARLLKAFNLFMYSVLLSDARNNLVDNFFLFLFIGEEVGMEFHWASFE